MKTLTTEQWVDLLEDVFEHLVERDDPEGAAIISPDGSWEFGRYGCHNCDDVYGIGLDDTYYISSYWMGHRISNWSKNYINKRAQTS